MKKRTISITLALILILTLMPFAAASADIRVTIDGQPLTFDVAPQNIAGRVMVPMRAIFEALDAVVEWDESTRTITAITCCGCEIILTIGSTAMYINGEAKQMDVAPILAAGGRTLVPVRFVAQALGHEVFWEASTSTVMINTDPFTRLNPQPVTLTQYGISLRELGCWIIHYQYTGGKSALEREVVRLLNIERERVGVPPLTICPLLSAAARFKSQEMADLRYFSHDSPVYGSFDFIPATLFGAFHIAGENIARRVEVADMAGSIMQVLMDSPGHRANMLHPGHEVVGVGVVMSMGAGVNFDGSPIENRYAALATQMFGWNPGYLGENPVMEMYRELFEIMMAGP